MTAFTLGEATTLALGRMGTGGTAGHAAPRRAGAPVRRGSMEAGTFEALFFARPAKGEPDRMIRAARAALDAGRRLKRSARLEARELAPVERALAALTAGAVRVYEELCMLARVNGGRVFPSYDRLAQATALGRATVARAVGLLEAAGFLVRQRRIRRVEASGAGPRYEQTSNAYRPTLPRRLMDYLPRWARPAPVPVDVAQAARRRAEEQAAMKASLSARELAATTGASGALGRVLARLGAAIDAAERESHDRPGTRTQIDIKGTSGTRPDDRWPDDRRRGARNAASRRRCG